MRVRCTVDDAVTTSYQLSSGVDLHLSIFDQMSRTLPAVRVAFENNRIHSVNIPCVASDK